VTGGEAAPAAAERGSRNLLTRIAAALVLAPAAIAIAWAGGWFWVLLVSFGAIGLYIEWLIVVGLASEKRIAITGIAALACAAPAIALGRLDIALGTIVVGGFAVVALSRERRGWAAAGFCYAAAAQLASVLVRFDAVAGFAALIMVLLVVWVTDIGGYFAGRGIGGPKLWPRVSPKKTWAGAFGGFVASLAVAGVMASSGLGRMAPLLLLGAVLSVSSQLGDLFESAVKRRFGVKDSSHIIPGHGGLLDRLDGFVAAIVLAALIGTLRGGVDGVGRGLMVW
jgi:phosphatidate cytidylyltransferase